MRIPRVTPQQPLTYLWERHREMMRRIVAGDKPIEIARDMNMTPTRMSIIMNSPAFKNELARLSSKADEAALDIRTRIRGSAVKAMDLLEQALDPKAALHQSLSGANKVKVAQDMLDRDGHGAVQKAQVNVNHAHLTGDDIAELRRRRAARLMETNG